MLVPLLGLYRVQFPGGSIERKVDCGFPFYLSLGAMLTDVCGCCGVSPVQATKHFLVMLNVDRSGQTPYKVT